jgi:hypothetical protein
MKVDRQFESHLCNCSQPYSRITAENLLSLEAALVDNLKTVRVWLSNSYTSNSSMTTREAIETGRDRESIK